MKLPIKLRRTKLLTKLVIALVVVSCAAILVSQQAKRQAYEVQGQELESQIAELREKNQELREDIAGMDTDEGIKKIARDELGLVGSDEIIFFDIGD